MSNSIGDVLVFDLTNRTKRGIIISLAYHNLHISAFCGILISTFSSIAMLLWAIGGTVKKIVVNIEVTDIPKEDYKEWLKWSVYDTISECLFELLELNTSVPDEVQLSVDIKHNNSEEI